MHKLSVRFSRLGDARKIHLIPIEKDLPLNSIKYDILSKQTIIATFYNKVVGILRFEYLWKSQPFMNLIYVEESYRNNGVGKKLLAYLEKYLKKKGFRYLFSSSSECTNNSCNWHEKVGFKPCGTVDKLNLPDSSSKEIFFYKKLP